MIPVIIGAAAGLGLIGIGAKKIIENCRAAWEERQRRRSTPIIFPDGFDRSSFENLVREEAGKIDRIVHVEIRDGDIECLVRSRSGISEWSFIIDLNDYGSLVGQYWIWTENHDSDIPRIFADRIQSALRQ